MFALYEHNGFQTSSTIIWSSFPGQSGKTASWCVPPQHHWYQSNRPGGSLTRLQEAGPNHIYSPSLNSGSYGPRYYSGDP
ncbi:hypothetical protein TNCT_89901 [Trichonephila clavata]|uniref:Uncharacterized protein n=1 Tax=Trichonephila clavata TaxID=2740835 RepID=A0A8X6I3S1_TRICU|nr:hypothetical protein TNCT_89901 [Trichonephila clavata]